MKTFESITRPLTVTAPDDAFTTRGTQTRDGVFGYFGHLDGYGMEYFWIASAPAPDSPESLRDGIDPHTGRVGGRR